MYEMTAVRFGNVMVEYDCDEELYTVTDKGVDDSIRLSEPEVFSLLNCFKAMGLFPQEPDQ